MNRCTRIRILPECKLGQVMDRCTRIRILSVCKLGQVMNRYPYFRLCSGSDGCLEPELQSLEALRIVLVHELPVPLPHQPLQLGKGRRLPANKKHTGTSTFESES